MALTEAAIISATPGARPYTRADEKGLYLIFNPNGSRWWRYSYRFGGKHQTLSMGVYPEVGLDLARAKRDEARAMLARGINPAEVRKYERSRSIASIRHPPLHFSMTESGGIFIETKGGKMLLNAEQVTALRAFLDATKEPLPCF